MNLHSNPPMLSFVVEEPVRTLECVRLTLDQHASKPSQQTDGAMHSACISHLVNSHFFVSHLTLQYMTLIPVLFSSNLVDAL